MSRFLAFLALAGLAAAPSVAQTGAPATSTAARPPRLIVAISVDQFSADLFAEYRNRFTGGFRRLLDGQVFPSGYQSHAATETCPGHSTILTGFRPEHTGIIANDWFDQAARSTGDGKVYCVEDETVPGSDYAHQTVSDRHLLVPTLGDRMKAADPRSRVVAVAGKDRAAVLLGGHATDQAWWWNQDHARFESFAGRPAAAAATATNAEVTARLARAQPAMAEPDWCRPRDREIVLRGDHDMAVPVGAGRFARAAGDIRAFRASPELDASIVDLAIGMVHDLRLGRGPAPDLLAVGLSATDYVGHSYGTEGNEMCLQLAALDRGLDRLFRALDATGVDYQVVLTADHGGHDIPERNQQHGAPMDAREAAALTPGAMSHAIAADLHLAGPVLLGTNNGDTWVSRRLSPDDQRRVLTEALRRYRAHPQVQAVFTRDEILATPDPSGPPETWTLLQRARASYRDGRSGDFIVVTRPRIVGVPTPAAYYVATHGSFWDYDRRVPILFWRRGTTGFEQPLSVETVDIAPTLMGVLGLRPAAPAMDGRCLDLDAGTGSTCP